MRGGKIFGGILGWAFLGPIGAIFGVAAGHLVDRIAGSQDLRKRIQSSAEADEKGSRWSRRETRKEREARTNKRSSKEKLLSINRVICVIYTSFISPDPLFGSQPYYQLHQ